MCVVRHLHIPVLCLHCSVNVSLWAWPITIQHSYLASRIYGLKIA